MASKTRASEDEQCGRRDGGDRRLEDLPIVPERRSGKDRRSGGDRRTETR